MLCFVFALLDSRLVGAEVRVGMSDDISANTQCGSKVIASQVGQNRISFVCGDNTNGRYVSLQVKGRREYLNFCELQVMAKCKHTLCIPIAFVIHIS
jgi:hypothetical protein